MIQLRKKLSFEKSTSQHKEEKKSTIYRSFVVKFLLNFCLCLKINNLDKVILILKVYINKIILIQKVYIIIYIIYNILKIYINHI